MLWRQLAGREPLEVWFPVNVDERAGDSTPPVQELDLEQWHPALDQKVCTDPRLARANGGALTGRCMDVITHPGAEKGNGRVYLPAGDGSNE